MRDDQRSVDVVAEARIESSRAPNKFRRVMNLTVVELAHGSDLATAAWSAADPVRLAAEIEALAGARRLARHRKDFS